MVSASSLASPVVDGLQMAASAGRNIVERVRSHLSLALMEVQSPSMSSVYQPRVQASGHASADQQQGTDEVLGALVLLQQDQGELHPRLKRELQALVCAALAVRKGLSAKDAEHFLQIICLGPQAQALLESPATRDRLAMLWRAAPHVGGTLDDYVQNCLAYLQGKLLQASGDLALLEGGVPLGKIRQLQREQFGPYPSHGVVSDRQAELEALLRQAHSQALSGEWGQSMQRLNQSLHRHEWLVQVPAQVLQQVLRHGLRQHLPSTALFTQVKQLFEQGFDIGALQRDWQAVWSQLRDGRSVSEVLGGLNTALERGVLTPVAVLYGVIGLASAPLVWGPLGLILAAVVQAGEEGLSGAMRQWVGEAESEAARSLQEVARLSSNCQALQQVAAPVLEPLGRWVQSLRAAAADTARLEIAAIDLLQQHLSLELPEDCGSNATAWRESMLQSRFVRTLQQEQTELRALPKLHPAQQQRLEQLERTTAKYEAYLDAPRPVHVWLTDLHEERERWHEQLNLLGVPLQPELLEGDSGRGRLDPKTKAALLEQAKRARGMVGAAQASTEGESGAGELFAQERLMATASSGAGRMTGVASLIKPAVDGLRYGARGAAAALRAIYNLMATQPPNPVADVELQPLAAAGTSLVDSTTGTSVTLGAAPASSWPRVVGTIAGMATMGGMGLGAWLKSTAQTAAEPLPLPVPVPTEGNPDAAGPVQMQALMGQLSLTPHVLPDGSWVSSLDALSALISQSADPHSAQQVQRVRQLLAKDGGYLPLNFSGEVPDADTAGLATRAPRRQRRELGAAMELATTASSSGAELASDIALESEQAVHALITSVQQEQVLQQSTLLLQQQWLSSITAQPNMYWLERAPMAEQRLWLDYAQLVQARQQQMLVVEHGALGTLRQSVQQQLQSVQLPGTPEDYVLTYAVTPAGMSAPIHLQQTLLEACQLADVWKPEQLLEVSRNGESLPLEKLGDMRRLLSHPACHDSLSERMRRVQADKALLTAPYTQLLDARLRRDVLEAKLQGHLTGGREAWQQGLEVVLAALRDDPHVQVGYLEFSTGVGSESARVQLTPWLVLLRERSEQDDGVVLYRPDEQTWGAFNSRQQLYQYLDKARLRQSLAAEQAPAIARVTEGAASLDQVKTLSQVVMDITGAGDRPKWRHFFQQQALKLTDWSPLLRFHAFTGTRFADHLEQWASMRLERMHESLQALAKLPALPAKVALAEHLRGRHEAYVEGHLPSLREFTRRNESKSLSQALQLADALPTNRTINADAVRIEFNGRNMSWTDWVVEGYRHFGDTPFVGENNFLGDQRGARGAQLSTDDPDVVLARLNAPDFKQSVQAHLRSTYAGEPYVAHLRQWLDPQSTRAREFSELHGAWTLAQLELALAVHRASGQIGDTDYRWMQSLLGAVPASTRQGNAQLRDFRVAGRRIPEVWVLSLRQPLTPERTSDVAATAFVFLLKGPYGNEVMPLAEYQQRIRQPAYLEDVLSRTRLVDKIPVDQVLRGARDTADSTASVGDFSTAVVADWLGVAVDNTNEYTTSRAEMIRDQIVKTGRYAAAGVCLLGTAQAGAVLCGMATGLLMGVDLHSARQHLHRGQEDEAWWDVVFLGLDGIDVGVGLRALMIRRMLYRAGRDGVKSASEAAEVLSIVEHQRGAFTVEGRLNKHWAQSSTSLPVPMVAPPGRARAGTFYQAGDKILIVDQGRYYEVYSDNVWATVRVRDPQRPHGPGAPVVYRGGRWRSDDGGLLGGGASQSARRNEPAVRFASPEALEDYLQAFDFGALERDQQMRERLIDAVQSGGPLPGWSRGYLVQGQEWRAYGMLGTAPELKFGKDLVARLSAGFEFPDPGNEAAMRAWLTKARLNPAGSHLPPLPPPDWAIFFARDDRVWDLFGAQRVLQLRAGMTPSLAQAYIDELADLSPTARQQILQQRIGNPQFALPTDLGDRLEQRIQALVERGVFASEDEAHAYLLRFELPIAPYGSLNLHHADGVVLSTALLSVRASDSPPPSWVGDYLPAWRQALEGRFYTEQGLRQKLAELLAEQKHFSSTTGALHYLEQFDAQGTTRALLSGLAMDQLLSRRSIWAFEAARPESRMLLFRSQDISAEFESFVVDLTQGASEAQIVLPRQMPRLKRLRVINQGDEIPLVLPQDMPELVEIEIRGVGVGNVLSLGGAAELQFVQLETLQDLERLHLPRTMPMLSQLEVKHDSGRNALQLVLPQELPNLVEMKLGGVALGAALQLHGMPALQLLYLKRLQGLQNLDFGTSMPDLEVVKIQSLPQLQGALRLPERTPKLEYFLVSETGSAMVSLPTDLSRLEALLLSNVNFRDPLLTWRGGAGRLEEVFFQEVHNLERLDLHGPMPSMQRLQIENNPRLIDVQMHGDWGPLGELTISGNPSLDVTGLLLPEQLNQLEVMYLGHNGWSDLTFLHGRQLPRLNTLELDHNQLSHLDGLPPLPSLYRLILSHNRFRVVPEYIAHMALPAGRAPSDFAVFLDNNPLIERARRAFEEDLQRSGRYTGPMVDFGTSAEGVSLVVAPAREAIGRSLVEAAERWAGAALGQRRNWADYKDESFAAQFAAYLDRLAKSPSQRSANFRAKVGAWLTELETDATLRQQTFMKSLCATETCDDRIALVFNEMQDLLLRSQVEKGDYDARPAELLNLMRGQYRLQELDRFAQVFVRRRPQSDDIEVFLGLREKLHSRLQVPIDTADMQFFGMSGLKKADVDAAEKAVLRDEATGGFNSYLANSEVMQSALRRRFQSKFEQRWQELEQVLSEPDSGPFNDRMEAHFVHDGLGSEMRQDQEIRTRLGPVVARELTTSYLGPLLREFFGGALTK